MKGIVQDLRHTARGLWKSPAFTAVAVATLALGIGANTAILGVVNGILLRPLPFPKSDRLVMIREDNPSKGFLAMTASPPNFLDWRAQNHSLQGIAAFVRAGDALTGSGDPEWVKYAQTTSEFFSVLGTGPELGRTFSEGECVEGKDRVAVLSDALWRRRWGGRPDVVGSTLHLSGAPYTVIGVMPPRFEFPVSGHELWIPLSFPADVATQRGAHYLSVIGRLRPGVSLATAESEMKNIASRLAEAYPRTNSGSTASVKTLKDQIVGNVRPALLILMGAVGLVVLIACANVANLLLARGAAREREFAVRLALGAGRARLIRQMLTESAFLSCAGTGVAIFLAAAADRLISQFGPRDLPRMSEIGIDPAVLAVTAALAAATTVLFGLFPALRSTRLNLAASLKETFSTGGPARERLRSLLVAGEIALALLLLVGAGLLVKSFSRLLRVDPGFQPGHVLTFDLSLDSKYKDTAAQSAFFRTLLGEINRLPGVRASGSVFCAPLSDSSFSSSFSVRGAPVREEDQPSLNLRVVSPDYFRTMKIPLVAGRLFTDQDRRGGQRVMLLTRTAARKFWPGGNAIGQHLRLGARPSSDEVEGDVIGIVGDTRDSALDQDPRPAAYFPLDQVAVSELTMVVRTAQRPESIVAAVRETVRRLDGDLPIVGMTTMDDVVSRSVARPRFYAFLLLAFATGAVALAAVGVYGVLSFSVSRRTREIGVRIAVGAARRDVLLMVLGNAARLSLFGLAAGTAAAIFLTRLLSGILFDVKPFDPATYAAVSALLFGVALVAALVPALRASSVDPMTALRDE
ncbi:MAG: ABC transporter permease [Thermoanaerobaculia bacterium]